MNRWRSPTAEQVFSEHPGVECRSAGLNRGAENPLTPELVEWADLIFVMERDHKTKLSKEFQPYLRDKRLLCLNIPDNYRFMEPTLVKLLHAKVTGFLPHV
ncbi:low molecular weight protein tyrosine phosphatase family protein [Undibacterium sp. Ren11W]|uniref:low molecular weight protein tyrosine phosphatase family protein n=1 Tax=Undibacterium sp. Ren11W TaxID=3413045 RepID=UPI003BF3A099